MSLLDRIQARATGYPVGAEVLPWEREYGHADDFGPAKYGDYIATSADVYWAVNLRARLISSVPLRAYRGADSEKDEVRDGPVVDLLRSVNPFWTFKRLMYMTEMSKGLWGEAFWVVQRDDAGRPRELWWVKPTQMRPVPHPKEYLAGYVYEPAAGGEPIPFGVDEVVWHRYPNPLDEFAGLSPIAAARQAADNASAMMKSNGKLFEQGMQVAGIIAPPDDRKTFTEEQAEDLERKLDRRLRGVDKAHRWAVLRYEAKFSPMNITPKDAEFVRGLQISFRQVCNAYGLQAALGNDLEHATLSNAIAFDRVIWEHTLVPELATYASELIEQLLPMFRAPGTPDHLEFDLSRVAALQESETSVWEREGAQIERGALTINEWRRKHGYPEVAWGDVYWAPVNKAPVTSGEDTPADNPDVPNDTGVPASQEPADASAERVMLLAAAIAAGQTEQIRELVASVSAPREREVVERDEFGRVARTVERVTDGAG